MNEKDRVGFANAFRGLLTASAGVVFFLIFREVFPEPYGHYAGLAVMFSFWLYAFLKF
ncbi:hypothetical protein IWQ48_003796 [Labrenzia sp. EL_13]|nr:hypothetical protein [Labrenzia sp. EL_13]